jgi:hypothetical protein
MSLEEIVSVAINSVVAGVENKNVAIKAICEHVDNRYYERAETAEVVSDLIMKLHQFEKDALSLEELNSLSGQFELDIIITDDTMAAHPTENTEAVKKMFKETICTSAVVHNRS